MTKLLHKGIQEHSMHLAEGTPFIQIKLRFNSATKVLKKSMFHVKK